MRAALIAIAFVVSCQAQSPAFEVASVKLNRLGGDRGGISLLPGRITVSNMTLKGLVRYAYDVRDIQISGGPPWFDSDRWDIAATATGTITDEERRQMLQTLLADRFQLTLRLESKELPVYALTLAKSGSKMKPNPDEKPPRLQMGASVKGLLKLNGEDAPVSRLAAVLVAQVGRIVVDRTGLEGRFDFSLEWVPDAANLPSINGAKMVPAEDGPSLFTAVQEQLGLRLESTKAAVEVLVIDRAQKAAEN
jgi:uncharacterized protein (TIGR03435 family)